MDRDMVEIADAGPALASSFLASMVECVEA
jgi:hypothetical protein